MNIWRRYGQLGAPPYREDFEQPTGHSGLTSKAEEEGFKVSRFKL